jgi:putative transposase
MDMRGKRAIRATVSMEIASSDFLPPSVNNYVEALGFVSFWLKESVKVPHKLACPCGGVSGEKMK